MCTDNWDAKLIEGYSLIYEDKFLKGRFCEKYWIQKIQYMYVGFGCSEDPGIKIRKWSLKCQVFEKYWNSQNKIPVGVGVGCSVCDGSQKKKPTKNVWINCVTSTYNYELLEC